MTALWWVWIAAGLGLAIMEVLLPGYVFVGMAVGAVATGLLLWSGQWPAEWMAESLSNAFLVFALMSLLVWIVFRAVVGVRKGQVKTFDRDINED